VDVDDKADDEGQHEYADSSSDKSCVTNCTTYKQLFHSEVICLLTMASVSSSPRTIGGEMKTAGGCRRPRRRQHRKEGEGAFPADLGVWGNVVSSPAGSKVEPRPQTILVVYKPAQNASRCILL